MKRMLVSTANQLTSGSRFVNSSAPNGVLRIDNVAFTMDDPEYVAYAYAGAGNELTKVWNENGPMNLAYDAAGRIITKTTSTASQSATYSWRYGGKLFQVANTIPAEFTVATYSYRGDGKLFQETYGFGTPYKRFHWDGWRLIGEEDNTGTLQRSYVQQPGVPYGATLAEAPGSNPGAADYRYFGRDAHGSSRAIFAQDKARIGTADWHPYGIQRQGFGLSSALAFTGQWKSSYTGDYQFGLRTYSPGLARWLSRDSLGYVDGPNMHAYAKANPIGYVDAQGGLALAPIAGAILLGGIFGGASGALAQWLRDCPSDSVKKGFWWGALAGAGASGVLVSFGMTGAGTVISDALLSASLSGIIGRIQGGPGGPEFAAGLVGGALGSGLGGGTVGGIFGGIAVGALVALGDTLDDTPCL